MIILFFYYWLIFPLIASVGCGHAMDFSLLSVPGELKQKILLLCHSELDSEERIAELVKLREVCKEWSAILTDRLIADTVGIPNTIEGLSQALLIAARGQQLKTVELICKVCPIEFKQIVFQNMVNDASSWFGHDTLDILLAYGLDPNMHSTDQLLTIGSQGLLLHFAVSLSPFYEEEMIDLLIVRGADTTTPGLLEQAAYGCPPSVCATLLKHRLHQTTDYATICDRISSRWCCKHHYADIVRELVSRGASGQYEQLVQALPDHCNEHEGASFRDLNSEIRNICWRIAINVSRFNRFDFIRLEPYCRIVEANRLRLEALHAQYAGRQQLAYHEYETYSKRLWPILDQADKALHTISQITGQPVQLWGPQYTASGHIRPDMRNKVVKFLSDFKWHLGILACYGALVYWLLYYDADTTDAEHDDEGCQEAAADSDVLAEQPSQQEISTIDGGGFE